MIVDLSWEIGVEIDAAKNKQDGFEEFMDWVTANLLAIPNDAHRCRHGEPIATGFLESAGNAVVSKRCVMKHSMRRTPHGAHQLLPVRVATLNHRLRSDFERWHPRRRSVGMLTSIAA